MDLLHSYAFGTSLVTVSCFIVISNHYFDARPNTSLNFCGAAAQLSSVCNNLSTMLILFSSMIRRLNFILS